MNWQKVPELIKQVEEELTGRSQVPVEFSGVSLFFTAGDQVIQYRMMPEDLEEALGDEPES